MNRSVKKYMILFFVIFIPLLAAFLVGSYGYNSAKFGQGSWKEEFVVEYLTFEDEYTTRDKILKYMEYGINNQYYSFDPTPVYDEEIKKDDMKLLDLLVYRVVYDLDNQGNDRFQYIFFFYNVQYLNLRLLFDADPARQQEINNANVPLFVAQLHEILDDEEETPAVKNITQISEEQLSFPDYDSDVDYKNGKKATDVDGESDSQLVKVYMGFIPLRETTLTKNYKFELSIKINTILDDYGSSITADVVSKELVLETDPSLIDYSSYTTSHKQDLSSAGYFGWAFKHYIWWISLIAFVAIGAITVSFYLVLKSEEKRIQLEQENKKKKRK